ncbi:hypothetical protein AB0M95_15690 [Sphaerisporangium sp. NPDC051017]|uniref:hypothetical protein n=1 Tax=Sphaerisporangium sp. NPDC051017 TaxID=3154636 RepID=UPI00342FB177
MSSLDAAFALFSGGITVDAGSAAAVHASLDALAAALAPWRAATSYRNFSERLGAGLVFEPAEVRRRLREIKKTYDPLDVIRANHPVRPALSI